MIISILHGVLLDRRTRKEINMRADKEEVMKKSEKREKTRCHMERHYTVSNTYEGNI